MITKEQIEEAASKHTLDCEEYTGFVAGANWALEQCPYSMDDMIGFGNYCINSRMALFADELLKCWEEQK